MKKVLLKSIRIIEALFALFFLIGFIGSVKEFSNITFWISFIFLVSIVFVPLEFLHRFITKKISNKKEIEPITIPENDKTKNGGHTMGLKDLVKQQMDAYSEKKELAAQRQREYNEQTHIMMNLTSGFQKIKCSPNCALHQKPDGTVFFGHNSINTYLLVSYEWNGPQYNTITNSNTRGTQVKKGKAGKIGVGAVIGTAFGPAGTLVGAAMGAGSKGVKNTQSHTTSVSQQLEIPTPATLKLKNIQTDEVFGLTFNCTSQLDAKIKALRFESEMPEAPMPENLLESNSSETDLIQESATASDPYEELRKLKELLDMGIVTQDEFDAKKRQLLNL